jgi:DNA helicase IV
MSTWLIARQDSKNTKKKALEREANILAFFKPRIKQIRIAEDQFSNLINIKTGYFSNYDLESWRTCHLILYYEIKDKDFETPPLEKSAIQSIQNFKDCFANSDQYRQRFNKRFIELELASYQYFFNSIENRKLDLQQRTAIVVNEDNNLVVAGAGSGKTTTIVGKINYLVQRYKVAPEQILLVSFTKKSASTLADRVNAKRIDVKTFHSFGLEVISEVERKQPSIFDEAQLKPFISKTFKELLKNEDYIAKVTRYFTDFMKPYKPQEAFNNQGEYIEYLKSQDFRTYNQRTYYYGEKVTIRREVVKSIEECKIANFLLFNGIDYQYELPYEHNTATEKYRQYKPDFTINQKGKRVYLEHFGINKNGEVPPFFAHSEKGESHKQATARYKESILWKQGEHRKNQTKLIETYSYEMSNGVLFDNLTKRLKSEGITLKPKAPNEIWQIIQEVADAEVKSMISLFQTFIALMKSNNYNIESVVMKNTASEDDSDKERNALFLEIIKPIFHNYQSHLSERGEIDFSDMINLASSYLANGQYKKKISYLIIDEFQDMSIGRYQLVKAIKEKNPACKLFCVGDDWQSIYRFGGSDIALFKEFEKYFGYTVQSKIETTYRFQNPLIDLSSKFILKNHNQTKKELKGFSLSKSTNCEIVYTESNDKDITLTLIQIFDELILNDVKIESKNILLLGRYSFDVDSIKNTNEKFQIDDDNGLISYTTVSENFEIIKLNAQFLTVHKAKGLEADIVIILNCNSGKYGFPSEMSDDKVLNLLLSNADRFENGEERRLFYVAMTRAKEKVIFIANNRRKSKFLTELEVESGDKSIKKCPRCKTTDLVLRTGITNGKDWGSYTCRNFTYGCDYIEWVDVTKIRTHKLETSESRINHSEVIKPEIEIPKTGFPEIIKERKIRTPSPVKASVKKASRILANPTKTRSLTFTVFDVETATHNYNSICQFAICRVVGGQIVESKSWLIQPQENKYESILTSIHGINANKTRYAPSFEEVWDEILPYLHGNLIFCYNYSFDIGCLRQTLDYYAIENPSLWFGCSYRLAKALLPEMEKYNLKHLALQFDIDLQHHYALSDANATVQILLKMAQRYEIKKNADFATKSKYEWGLLTKDVYLPYAKV